MLIDTGSEVNIIKIDKLRGELIVNEKEKVRLRGINEKTTETIGTINIPIEISNNEISVKFNLVEKDFPIPKDGILGHTFLSKNKVIVDIANKVIIINNEEDNICFTLNPRTETIVEIPIADPKVESKNIFVHKQEIKKKMYCAKERLVQNKVKSKKRI